MAMLKWGHNCQLDGIVNINQMLYTVVQPDGTIGEVSAEVSDEGCIDLTADTLEEGFYTFIADYNNPWAKYGERDEDYKFGDRTEYPDAIEVRNYHQYATMVVPVGHFHENEMYDIPFMEMRILPTTGMNYQASHPITFRVVRQGKPAVNANVILVHMTDDGTVETPLTVDANGMVTVTPEVAGTYCVIARDTDETKDPEGKYEATSFTGYPRIPVLLHTIIMTTTVITIMKITTIITSMSIMTTMIMSAAAVITTTKYILHPAGSPVGCFLFIMPYFLGIFSFSPFFSSVVYGILKQQEF